MDKTTDELLFFDHRTMGDHRKVLPNNQITVGAGLRACPDKGPSVCPVRDGQPQGVAPAEETSGNIEEILRERNRIDQLIREKFKKQVTILFTDICDYTQYMDTRGDVSGRSMLQKHNDIVLPLVEKHEGVVVKIIGDAVMATFHAPLAAVKASIAIQNFLHEHNLKQAESERIHVKIGINTGDVLIDQADIFGDAVNVASRIQSQADKDQTLISKRVYEEIANNEDIICRLHGTVKVKGKAQPLELYRVLWRQEDVIMNTGKVRAGKPELKKRGGSSLKVIQLELTREDNRLKISAYEQRAGEISTIRRYEEIPVTLDRVEARCREIVETLNNANRKGLLAREAMIKLREIGQVFRDELFTPDVKEKLKKTKADHLILNLDDRLVHIPWELLHDGRLFLCQQFNMGRLVKTRQAVIGAGERLLGQPLKMLILADPRGDLKGAYQEGIQIRDFMDQDKDIVNTSLRGGNITSDFIREKIRNFDLVHFAGHADYNRENPGESGWRLTDGIIKAEEIIKMAGTAAMPAFIFSNACQSARTEEWEIREHFQDEIFGLANAFILSGVKHYVGTFWEILDEPSRYFALEFYKHLFSGITIGEALRKARFALINKYGEESIVWASYLLYGDPTFNYMDQIRDVEQEEETEIPVPLLTEPEVRSGEDVVDFSKKTVSKKRWRRLSLVAGITILLLVFLFWYPGFLKNNVIKYERAAIAYYNEGNFDEALNACKIIEDKSAGNRLAYLIEGDIYLRRGKLDAAETAYRKALDASKGTDQQKAGALMGLGRIASIRKQTDVSISYYQQATKTDPAGEAGYLSQAILMDKSGDSEQALSLLDKARQLAPDDRSLAVIANEIQRKVSFTGDQKKQERIDKIVKELLESMKSPSGALPLDGWTSVPLTIWIMDFEAQGYSMHEGEERLIVSGITDQVLQHSRVQIVERALLDRLLGELKLGTSKLIDRSAALSIGKILAARLILSGRIIYSGPETQVSMRLIETETGRITAALNESFGSALPASVLSDKLSENLLNKLKKLYPLQGKISELKGKEVTLNIGQKVGVTVDQHFQVANEDITLEVIAVQLNTSLAKIVKGDRELIAGQRIVEIK